MTKAMQAAITTILNNNNTLHISSNLQGKIVTSPYIHPTTLRKLFASASLTRKDGQYSWYSVK